MEKKIRDINIAISAGIYGVNPKRFSGRIFKLTSETITGCVSEKDVEKSI